MAATARRTARKVVRRAVKAVRAERTAWPRHAPIISGQVLYESFSGNGMLDHPESLFRRLLTEPDMQHLTHVWTLTDLDRYRRTVERYRDHPRVRFVVYRSAAYFAALARSQYLVNNATFPAEFGKRDGQVYLNTWHGTPMKNMGYDVPGGGPATRNIIRNFVSADYLLSSSEFMTRQMYETAYRLRGIYRGRVVQEGSPRIDRQFLDVRERAALRGELTSRGLTLAPHEQIVLYAPTWKGSFYTPTNDVKQLLACVRSLRERIDTSRYRVLLKVHQRVFDFAAGEPELRDVLVPNDVPTNCVLGITDVLITDYSSVFFDFLVTGRPVLFYLPDEADYRDARGLYVPTHDWPGPVTGTLAELAGLVTSIGTGSDDDPLVTHAEAYARARQEYCGHEDGAAAERIVDVVFRGRSAGYDVRELRDDRTSILMYLGGMLDNGITTSALNLLNNIDHDRFDVSVCYPGIRRAHLQRNEARIHPSVRLFPRVGGINGSKLFSLGRRAMLKGGVDAGPAAQRTWQNRLFRDEWLRCFGMSTFDHIVDFSGYGAYWDYVLLQGEAKTRSIWLHNDLMADAEREVNGRKPLQRGLQSVFSTYRFFDNLVSVSPALADVNRAQLSAHASPDKFVSAVNTIDYKGLLRKAYGITGDDPEVFAPEQRLLRERGADSRAPEDERGASFGVGHLPSAVAALIEHHPLSAVKDEVRRQETIRSLTSPEAVTFVTAGRLSPEKNHDRLIRAFDLVHRDHPETRLVIMGSGPLANDLRTLVTDLGLVTAVTLAGRQDNPFAVMANSDCFVLSSDYEGQPLVLLEAMVLQKPVVSTSFASVSGILPEGHGLVVDRSVEALAEGMLAYLRGEVPAPVFDYEAYNRDAVQQFYTAIGATTALGDPAAADLPVKPPALALG